MGHTRGSENELLQRRRRQNRFDNCVLRSRAAIGSRRRCSEKSVSMGAERGCHPDDVARPATAAAARRPRAAAAKGGTREAQRTRCSNAGIARTDSIIAFCNPCCGRRTAAGVWGTRTARRTSNSNAGIARTITIIAFCGPILRLAVVVRVQGGAYQWEPRALLFLAASHDPLWEARHSPRVPRLA